MLGIGDVRTDKRIDFVGGARGTSELERLVNSGKAAVAFSMYPVSVDDLMADLGRRRHHAAEVDLVRAEAARRPAVAPDLNRSRKLELVEPMKVLIADKFEQSGLDGVEGGRLRRALPSQSLPARRSSTAIASTRADVLVVRSRPRSPRRCSMPARCR